MKKIGAFVKANPLKAVGVIGLAVAGVAEAAGLPVSDGLKTVLHLLSAN